jgi:VIT1/CCC1 family predicted Fe2+/Mn2+ transporter
MGRAQNHREIHKSSRSGWLRAAVLGSSDAIVSTSSLMLGVTASSAGRLEILVSGVAGLAAGALSMAVGEYVSVSSQRDAEHADIEKETRELATEPEHELRELALIYEKRGLEPALAKQVAEQLTAADALRSHLRDELGIDREALAAPFQAAFASALSFAAFALIPLLSFLFASPQHALAAIGLVSLASLALLGGLGGYLGGAPVTRAALLVTLGGLLAMLTTTGIGHWFGIAAP